MKRKIILSSLSLILISAMTLGTPVHAEEEEYVYSPNSNSAILELALENAGYNENARLAILGNLSVQTCGRFDPTIVNGVCDSTSEVTEFPTSGSIGLAQWSGSRKDNLKAFAEAEQASPLDIDTQIRFLIKEMNDNGFTPENLNKYSLEQSTYIIFRRFLTAPSDAPVLFQAYVKYSDLDDTSTTTVNYKSALAVAKAQSSVELTNSSIRAAAQSGSNCKVIRPSNASVVYGLNKARRDVGEDDNIKIIRACMNQHDNSNRLPITDTYDQALANAVTAFQKDSRLEGGNIWSKNIDGRVGKTTRCKICKALYSPKNNPTGYKYNCANAANCGGSSTPVEPTPETPTGTAVGAQSTSGYAKQNDYSCKKNGKWLKLKDCDWYWKYRQDAPTKKSDIKTSGCSFIAAVNALKYSGHINGNINDYIKELAVWTFNQKWTDGKGKINRILDHAGVDHRTLSLTGNNKNDLEAIKEELSEGNAITFYGKKKNNSCTVYTGGHYVAVIGVTAENKIVVANVAKGSSTIDYKDFLTGSKCGTWLSTATVVESD